MAIHTQKALASPGPRPAVDPTGATAAALFSFLICLYYGRNGIMPPDNSILFDAGWRVLQGQRPLLDFATPNGIPLAYLQALAFAVGGPNWGAYLATAAVYNAAFAAAAYFVLRHFGLGPVASALYAAACGVAFQTPIGTPFLDQGAFLFGLLAVLAMLRAQSTTSSPARAGLAGVLLALACLSKQIPGVFFVAVIGWVLLTGSPPRHWLRVGLWVNAGVLVTVLVFLASIRFHVADAWFFLLELPGALGALRSEEFARRFASDDLMRDAFGTVWPVGLFTWFRNTVVAIGLLALFGAGQPEGARRVLRIQGLAAILIALTYGFVFLTVNQIENGLGVVPLAMGLWHAALWPSRRPWLSRVGGAALLALTLAGAWEFNRVVNVTRVVNDMPFDGSRADALAPSLPAGLRPLRWSSPVPYGPADLNAVIRYASQPGHRVMILSDATFMNALAGQEPVFPALWLHPGLTIPTDAFPERLRMFEDRTIGNMEAHGTNAVVIEPEATWMEFDLSTLPRVRAYIERRFCLRPIPGTAFFRAWESCEQPPNSGRPGT